MKEAPNTAEETGISKDYFNEYAPRLPLMKLDGMAGVVESFRIFPVKKYEELFPTTEYANVVNAQNQAAVSRLDEIADSSNTRFVDTDQFTEDDFKKTINEVVGLIYGQDYSKIYHDV